MSLTVTRLARSCNLARSTVLYYESIGLLTRPRRSAGNYRVYSEKDLDRLRQICTYRDAGVALSDIRFILDAPKSDAAAVLRRRLTELRPRSGRLRACSKRQIDSGDYPWSQKRNSSPFYALPASLKRICAGCTPSSKPAPPTSTRSFWSSCTFRRKRSSPFGQGAGGRGSGAARSLDRPGGLSYTGIMEGMLPPASAHSTTRTAAVVFAGFCAFLTLFAPQPLLPMLAREFRVSAAAISLVVSASTLAVAMAAPFAGVVADRFGRKHVIVPAAFLLAVPTLLAATSTSYGQLLFWRFLQGVFTPGIFAVVIADRKSTRL